MYKFIIGNAEGGERLLAEESVRVDYSVLSVGVMTLGLIMIVEVVRHKIDHAAGRRPFPKAVLQGVYSECKLQGAQISIIDVSSHTISDSGDTGNRRIAPLHAIQILHGPR
jgi:hypothetical protein